MKIALVGAECEENLALRYIRASLELKGHDVTQVTFNAEADTDTAAACLARSDAALAGFSMVFTYRARQFAALAQRSRELGFRGHLVAGGHFAAFNAEALLREVPAFDSVAIGEGEELMCALANHLDSPSDVCGLVWRDGEGRIRRNNPAVKPSDLDRLPPPTRLQPPDAFLGLPIANLLGSRGCTHSCAFCSIAAWHKLCGGERLRLREPAAIAAEVAALYAQGYRIFNFHDDNFFLPDRQQSLQRFWRLRGELQARGVGRIAFAVKSRPDTVDEETFAFLKEFGLFRVFLGIEPGSAESLRRLGRGQTPGQNERALEIVNRLGLHACFNLLLLNPDSTLEDFRANVAFLRQHSINPMNFCRTEVYAGTPLEKRLREQNRLLGDYWGYNYTIGDARAQAAFELIYAGLGNRHFGESCVHHLAMRVDFERQILDHFWGCPTALHQRAKDFVRRVNLNSCDYLDEIADFAATRRVDRAAREEFLHGISARVRHDNERFTDEGTEIVRLISLGSQPDMRRFGMWQQDAAALLVSSLTLAGLTSCSQTQMFEMAHRPAGQAQQTDIAAKDILKRELGGNVVRAILGDLSSQMINTDLIDAVLNVTIDKDGSVTNVTVSVVLPGQKPAPVTNTTLTKAALTQVRLTEPMLRSRSWTIRYDAAELKVARPPTQIYEIVPQPSPPKAQPPTQIFEIAPEPSPPQPQPPTQIFEMAALPPQK